MPHRQRHPLNVAYFEYLVHRLLVNELMTETSLLSYSYPILSSAFVEIATPSLHITGVPRASSALLYNCGQLQRPLHGLQLSYIRSRLAGPLSIEYVFPLSCLKNTFF
jgi:hypothetical protein